MQRKTRTVTEWFVGSLLMVTVMQVPAFGQSAGSSDLRKEVEELKTQVNSLRSDLDQIKAMLREQSERANPVVDIQGDPFAGSSGAKPVMIEFSDFECPFCLEYFKTIYRQVFENYVTTGKIRYVFADFPGEQIHPHSLKTAEAARCAGEQGKFQEMHDQLFAHQRDFATTGIADSARAAGLNETQFNSCLASERYVTVIRAAETTADKLGIKGTPAFGIGMPDPANPTKIKLVRAFVGAQPYSAFQQAIDALLNTAPLPK